jgi:hypothetical protein
MKYTIEIIRWKREACEITIDATNTKDAQEQAIALYFGGHLEQSFDTNDQNFNPNKDERIKIYSQENSLEIDEEI